MYPAADSNGSSILKHRVVVPKDKTPADKSPHKTLNNLKEVLTPPIDINRKTHGIPQKILEACITGARVSSVTGTAFSSYPEPR